MPILFKKPSPWVYFVVVVGLYVVFCMLLVVLQWSPIGSSHLLAFTENIVSSSRQSTSTQSYNKSNETLATAKAEITHKRVSTPSQYNKSNETLATAKSEITHNSVSTPNQSGFAQYSKSNKTLATAKADFILKVNKTRITISDVLYLVKKSSTDDLQPDQEWHFSKKYHGVVNHPQTFRYLLNPKHLCKKSHVFLLIYVHTAPGNYKRRVTIRNTWGNYNYFPSVPRRLMFVMGTPSTASNVSQKAVQYEYDEYRDIMQKDFIDDYHNLTYKGLAALEWIAKYCSHATYTLKTDDDIFVNMFSLLLHLKQIQKYTTEKENKQLLMCNMMVNTAVLRNGKYEVSKSEFMGDFYPTYCSGLAWVMSTDLALRLHKNAYYVPFFWVDDLYITGFLTLKAGNISFTDFGSTYLFDDNAHKIWEIMTGPQGSSYLFYHVGDIGLIRALWNELNKLNNGERVPKISTA